MAPYRIEKAKLARQCTKSLRELLLGYRSLLEDALRGEGLTLPQLRLLHAIKEQEGVSGATHCADVPGDSADSAGDAHPRRA